MDVKTGAVWVWLDGKLVSDGVTPQADGKDNTEAFKGIRGIVLGDCSWKEEPSTPTYFDDLVIYTVP